MELARIHKLIEKYLEGESSLQEESTLKEYFTSDEVHPSLSQYSPLFHYFSENQTVKFEGNLQLEPSKPKKNWKWLSIAASFVLIFSIYTGKSMYDKQQADIAYQETQKALMMLSGNLQKGNQAIASIGDFNKTTSKIFKHD